MDKIVSLSSNNYDEIFALSQFAFQYRLNDEQLRLKEEEAERHAIWGYRIDGKLAGKLHIIPLHVRINGVSFPMGGISSVATWPEYRRQGIAKQLMIYSLQEMKRAGQTISYLHPFHVGFYRKFGWELAINRHQATIPIHQLTHNWDGMGSVRRSEENIHLLRTIYDRYSEKLNGLIIRDDLWWKQRVLTDDTVEIAIAYNDAKEAEGYILYHVFDSVCTVKEIAYTNVNGRNLLYEFIANHDSMATTVKMTLPENDPLSITLQDPAFGRKIEPYFMARIIDVQAFLTNYRFHKEDVEYTIRVTDPFIEENNGTFHVNITQGQATVQKKEQLTSDIQCSIQQLTSMLIGYRRPFALYEQHFITGNESNVYDFDRSIPNRTPYLLDFF